jgi:hypothetical protein
MPPIKIPSGTMRLGFFISPVILSAVSKPTKAKNKMSRVLLNVLGDGNCSQCRFAVLMWLKPKMIIANSGNSFIMAINFTKPTPCLAPLTFISTINPINIKNNKARSHKLWKTGKMKASESATILITAASPKMPHPKKTAS